MDIYPQGQDIRHQYEYATAHPAAGHLHDIITLLLCEQRVMYIGHGVLVGDLFSDSSSSWSSDSSQGSWNKALQKLLRYTSEMSDITVAADNAERARSMLCNPRILDHRYIML